ncbi:MAG: hypothetical protein EXR98_00225 [Gemmataceae bacterium]|nr:hypothetical protein [Gemmataceae bacterium]
MYNGWVAVATFQDPIAAAVVKNFLDAQGIPSELIDEATIATDWMLSGAIGGIKLQVAPLHLERAEMLLAQVEEEKAATDDEPPPPQTGIAAREVAEELQAEREDRAPINKLVDRIFRATVFGLILWPLQAYAFCLLVQLTSEEGEVSPNRRWKVWASLLLSLPILGVAFCVISWVVGVLFPS